MNLASTAILNGKLIQNKVTAKKACLQLSVDIIHLYMNMLSIIGFSMK